LRVLAAFDRGTTAVVMVSSIDVYRAVDMSHWPGEFGASAGYWDTGTGGD